MFSRFTCLHMISRSKLKDLIIIKTLNTLNKISRLPCIVALATAEGLILWQYSHISSPIIPRLKLTFGQQQSGRLQTNGPYYALNSVYQQNFSIWQPLCSRLYSGARWVWHLPGSGGDMSPSPPARPRTHHSPAALILIPSSPQGPSEFQSQFSSICRNTETPLLWG